MVYQVGRPAMFDGNMFLPDTGMPIWKMRAQQDEVGGLAAGAVDGGDLDAEIVDDATWRGLRGGRAWTATSLGGMGSFRGEADARIVNDIQVPRKL